MITMNQYFTSSRTEALDHRISELELPVRGNNILHGYQIRYVGTLVQYTEHEIMTMKWMNRKSLDEIIKALARWNLYLGMDVGSWTPPKKIFLSWEQPIYE